jgi:hypothetical protein
MALEGTVIEWIGREGERERGEIMYIMRCITYNCDLECGYIVDVGITCVVAHILPY